jgi:acetolactate synthase, small subunit
MTEKKEVISILVDNQYNVLSRISSLIGRRGFNIDTITASATQDPEITRITIGFTGTEQSLSQLLTQMGKLEIVREIFVLDPAESVFRELLLIKLKADKSVRSAIIEIVDIYRARIIDLSKDSMIIELTGAPDKIDGFMKMLDCYEMVEFCRTGVTGIRSG